MMSICIFLLIFKSGINITKLLSAKKKLEAKRKRHEKKMAKRRQQVRMSRDTAAEVWSHSVRPVFPLDAPKFFLLKRKER